ncbi:hypothetical protein [Lactiplantibacillus brownii]
MGTSLLVPTFLGATIIASASPTNSYANTTPVNVPQNQAFGNN